MSASRSRKSPGRPPSQRPGYVDRQASGRRPDDVSGLNQREHVAIHEAGHAVAAAVLGLPLRSVDVRRRRLPNGATSLGFTDCPINARDGLDIESLMPAMIQGLAGPMAEDRVNPGAVYTGAFESDYAAVRRMAAIAMCEWTSGPDGQTVIPPEEIRRNSDAIDGVAERAMMDAAALVERHWSAVEETARLLVERESLSGEDVRRIVAG